MKYSAILLFGAPGAGKGTQGKILGTIPGFFHFACGDAFRNLTIESEIGRVFIDYSSRGELVPDEITIRFWRQSIQARQQTGRFNPNHDILVLDGIPRSPSQAEMLEDTLEVKAVLHFTCQDMNKLTERLQRRALRENRLDDANLEIIRRRLEAYEKETRPVLEHYGEDLVHLIDSTQSPVGVLKNILSIITKVCPV